MQQTPSVPLNMLVKSMSSLSSYIRLPHTITIHHHYATSSSGKSIRKLETTDKRIAAIREILYAATPTPSSLPIRIPASDNGTSCSEGGISMKKKTKDSIERAWAITKMEEKDAIMKEVRRKYASMRKAMEVLESMDMRLFEGAIANNRIEKGTNIYPVQNASKSTCGDDPVLVFPRRLRLPTDTPSLKGWKYKIGLDSSDK